MYSIRLIHWNATEAQERALELRSLGYQVAHEPLDSAGLRALREDPPSAVVIDLSRLPSHGRDVALSLRKYKTTRHVPLVLVDGEAMKVQRIKELLPDAVYTTWSDIEGSLEKPIPHPAQDPVVPNSVFDAYSGTPLPKKLGIKAGSVVALVDAPERFEATLGELPEGVRLLRKAVESNDMILWFVRSRRDLEDRIEENTDLSRHKTLTVTKGNGILGLKQVRGHG
jgi:CheY-like chemotaxis protein